MDKRKDERTTLREREDVKNVFDSFFELQEFLFFLSYLFSCVPLSFVKGWSVEKYSSNNRLLKKKLPRYIIEKGGEKKKKENEGKMVCAF